MTYCWSTQRELFVFMAVSKCFLGLISISLICTKISGAEQHSKYLIFFWVGEICIQELSLDLGP